MFSGKMRLKYLPQEYIIMPSFSPRHDGDLTSLGELTASISRFGLLSPPVVRRRARNCYELICGSRRLSAAKLAGINLIPCLVIHARRDECTAISLAENLRRLPLDFVEESRAFARLADMGYSPEKSAELTGVTADHVRRSLQCLRLPKNYLEKLRSRRLTARHALALSRLGGDDFAEAFSNVMRYGIDGAATEEYVNDILHRPPTKKTPTILVSDARLFLNTVERGVDTMRRGGVGIQYEKEDADNELTLTITLPKISVKKPRIQ